MIYHLYEDKKRLDTKHVGRICVLFLSFVYYFAVDTNYGVLNNIIISSCVSFSFNMKVIVLYHIIDLNLNKILPLSVVKRFFSFEFNLTFNSKKKKSLFEKPFMLLVQAYVHMRSL